VIFKNIENFYPAALFFAAPEPFPQRMIR